MKSCLTRVVPLQKREEPSGKGTVWRSQACSQNWTWSWWTVFFVVFSRCLGRAPLHDASKHQIIIAKDFPLAQLLIQQFHQKSGHSGRIMICPSWEKDFSSSGPIIPCEVYWHLALVADGVRALLESKRWPICHALEWPQVSSFSCVGIDYFGPFLVCQKRSLVKCYEAIFSCFPVRAVHLEIFYTLVIDSFILALRHFIARRGQVKEMRSDNGTNFTGAEKKLRVMIEGWNQAKIEKKSMLECPVIKLCLLDRVATVREKSGKNKNFSRSGKS